MGKSQLTDILSTAAEAWHVPGASCAVWSDGKLTQAEFGVLNSDTAAPVTRASIFQIGSINKVLTATLVMILKDKELVDLDKPVRDYIPEFRIASLSASKSITVRQLLDHSNGIAGDFMPDTGNDRDQLERYLQRCALLPLCHRVGEGLSYSNAAYVIAGLLIERLSGLAYHEVMEQWLFGPLGMQSAVVDIDKIPHENVASGHAPDSENPERMKPLETLHTIPASTAPAGAATMMTAEDLIKFARLHLDGGRAQDGQVILSPEAVEEMQEITVTIPIPQRNISHWGIGWFFLEQGDQTLFGHDGGTIGQYAFLRLHKQTGTIVALLTNGGSANDCMLDVFAQTLEPMTGFRHTPVPEPVLNQNVDLTKYEGRFETVATVTDFWIEDGVLMRKAVMTLGDTELPEPPKALVYAGDETFLNVPKTGGRPSLITFLDPDASGVPQTMFSGLRVARRMTPL